MTEAEWLSASFAILFIGEAESIQRKGDDTPTRDEWRAVVARVACLQRLGNDMPEGVRQWVAGATAYLDEGNRKAPAGGLLDLNSEHVYRSFREAYAQAGPELRQKLAAAQDVFRGADYYCFEYYMLEEDETSFTYTGPVYAAESAAHCDLIRDIFGNPFRPVTIDPAWLTRNNGTVPALARAIYDDQAFDRLPILADALEDAGCHDAEILAHCRGSGPHVRGCWVVDLLLERT